jgi:hypothetical protein
MYLSTHKKLKKIFSSLSLMAIGTFILGGAILASTVSALPANAQTTGFGSNQAINYNLLAPLPFTNNCPVSTIQNYGPGSPDCQTDFLTYIKGGYKLFVACTAILAVIMIIWGGFEYMISGSEAGKNQGKERGINALWSLGFALFSFLVLNLIHPALTKVTLFVPPINAPQFDQTSNLIGDIDEQANIDRGIISRALNTNIDSLQNQYNSIQDSCESGDIEPDDCEAQLEELKTKIDAVEVQALTETAINKINRNGQLQFNNIIGSGTITTQAYAAAIELQVEVITDANSRIADLNARGKTAEANAVKAELEKVSDSMAAALAKVKIVDPPPPSSQTSL